MNKMNARTRIGFAVLIAILAVVFAYEALATCGCNVTLINGATTDITISKIKTSDTDKLLDVFKNQWVGTRKIKAGKKSNFNFTVDGQCGDDHLFRFIRQDGKRCDVSGSCGSTQTCGATGWF